MIRAFLNGALFAWVIALAAWWGFSMLDAWATEREARVACESKRPYRTVMVMADTRVKIRCDKWQPVVRERKK